MTLTTNSLGIIVIVFLFVCLLYWFLSIVIDNFVVAQPANASFKKFLLIVCMILLVVGIIGSFFVRIGTGA